MAAAALLNRSVLHKFPTTAASPAPAAAGIEQPPIFKRLPFRAATNMTGMMRWCVVADTPARCGRPRWSAVPAAAKADDSAPFEMSVENALKLLGVQEGASFDEVLRAKKATIASCKDDQEAISQVEAAYDMLLMQSLSQRRSGKVADSNIRYADVKQVRSPGAGVFLPQWLKLAVNNAPISVEPPSTANLGIQAGVYGALMVFTFVSGASMNSVGTYTGADVPGLILATSFGASIYFLKKKSINLGKAALMTAGGLVIGAVVGSAAENWLQVDIVPFLGIHSPAVIVSEFILFSQLLVSLYLR